MTKRPDASWSENQMRAYIASAADNLFVEAGAGAGKTTRLSCRILHQLLSGEPAAHFLVITYTKEAADELRVKIEKQLKRRIAAADAAERPALIHLLEEVPFLFISTFAFFSRHVLESSGIADAAGTDATEETLARLLTEVPELLSSLRRRFTHIYVDEFQDTDDIQKDIIWRIACDENGRLRDNALFMIGDSLQAIYRPGREQIDSFHAFREKMEKSGNASVLSLRDNFRSGPQIVSWVNEHFRPLVPGYRDMRSAQDSSSQRSFPLCGMFSSMQANPALLIAGLIEKFPSLTPQNFMIVAKDGASADRCRQDLQTCGIPCLQTSLEHEENDGDVQLLDVCSAKSLNRDIVIIPACLKRPDKEKGKVIFFSAAKDLLFPEQKSADQSLRTRREYVAATRAKHAVIFIPDMVQSGDSFWFDNDCYHWSSLPEPPVTEITSGLTQEPRRAIQ